MVSLLYLFCTMNGPPFSLGDLICSYLTIKPKTERERERERERD